MKIRGQYARGTVEELIFSIQAYQSGYTTKQIAYELSRDQSAIARWLRDEGVAMHPRGKRKSSQCN